MAKKPTTKKGLKGATNTRPPNVKGIRELLWVQAKHLADSKNPLNWRKHSQRQREAVNASVEENGWAGGVVYNETTGRMIDGHLRQDLDPEAWVPVFVGEFTEEQERRLLRDFDPLAAMAEMDVDAFRSLDEQIKSDLESTDALLSESNRAIMDAVSLDLNALAQGISDGVHSASLLPQPGMGAANGSTENNPLGFDPNFQPGEETKYDPAKDAQPVVQLSDYTPLSSSNELGIPDLRSDLLSDCLPTGGTWAVGANLPTPGGKGYKPQFFIYGSNRIGGPNSPPECKGSVLGFFTDDDRFEVTWNRLADIATRFRQQQWGGIVTPDFSTWWNWPLAHKIWNIYRQRYVGRYWQEAGLRIIPGLCCVGDIRQSALECAGIPKHCPVVSFEVRAGFDQGKDAMHERKILLSSLNNQLKLIEPHAVIVYGGADHREWLDKNLITGPKYLMLQQWATVRQANSDTFNKAANE